MSSSNYGIPDDILDGIFAEKDTEKGQKKTENPDKTGAAVSRLENKKSSSSNDDSQQVKCNCLWCD